MPLPADILEAVSAPNGGRLALVIGAGTSMEAPTSIRTSRECSLEAHRRLVADRVLQTGDCATPDDLSALADTVFAKRGSQHELVSRLRDQFSLRPPNRGHEAAAALLLEGAITSIVTLNFDLALPVALAGLGAGTTVGVIERPDQLANQKTVNIYFLHRSMNDPSPEDWVLRTVTLDAAWANTWQPIIATRVLSAPVVVFVGLGTPARVLLESSSRIKAALPGASRSFQVDVVPPDASPVFTALALTREAYVQQGWCDFMEELSRRLLTEHSAALTEHARNKVIADGLTVENIGPLLLGIEALGLVAAGKVKALWLSEDAVYCPATPGDAALLADLLLAVALVSRLTGTVAWIASDGMVSFRREERTTSTCTVVSGRGVQGRAAIEARTRARLFRLHGSLSSPATVIVAGTTGAWDAATSPPTDIARGPAAGDIVSGTRDAVFHHVESLRANLDLARSVAP